MPISLALKIKNIDEYNKFITGRGEQFIKDLLNSISLFDDKDIFKRRFMEILKVEEDAKLEVTFINKYKSIFSSKTKFGKFPYLEAVSMLGNSINFFVEEK